MKKSTKKLAVLGCEFASRALFVIALGDLSRELKQRTSSSAVRVAIDIATGVAVGLHALYRDDLVSSRLERIEAEPDPAPVADAEQSPLHERQDDWTGDEAPYVEEE